MGVRGLTSYVESQGQFWEIYKVRDTKLVIDGNGLYHYIYSHYNLDCKYGGQYGEFEEKVKVFFAKLTSHNVTPYVVFDGILDDTGKKLQTFKDRKKERIKRAHQASNLWNNRSSTIEPHLINLTLIKTLQELRVAYAVADFEADSDIVSLANALSGPVMGLDSDYFIFNLDEGYIPFTTFDFSGSSVQVKKFHSSRLARHLNIRPTMLPILASLVGNDYVSDEILKPFKIHVMQMSSLSQSISKGHAIISATAKFLSGFQSFEDVIERVLEKSINEASLEKALRLSVAEYQPKSTELINYFANSNLNSKLQTCNKREVPKWILKLYREGAFAKQCMSCLCRRTAFLKVQVEDMSKPSANQLTLEIRKFIYKLLMKYDEQIEGTSDGKEVVTIEYDREHLSLNQRRIVLELSSTDDTKVNISNLSTLDKHSKVAYLLNVLSCDQSSVQHLPNSCQLVVAALKYWIINAMPPVTDVHLASLLACHVGINDDQIQETCYDRLDVQSLHGFAQWQDVLYWVSYLNSIFGNEFPTLDPVKLYDGKKVCTIYQNLKSNGIQIVDTFASDLELFKQLFDAIVKNLPSHVTFKQSGRATDKKSKESKEQKATKMEGKMMKKFLRGNRFAGLSLSSSDED